VGPASLKKEQQVYAAAFPGDNRLRFLLSKQLELRGTLTCGAKFSREGARASGDFNTGMGNSLIFLVEVVACLRSYNLSKYDVLVDGDNVLVFLERSECEPVLAGFSQTILESSGHEVLLERPAYCLEDVRFGGSAPINLGKRGLTMVREHHRVISGAFSSHIYLREPVFAKNWMVGVAMCELSIAIGVPVLQAFFTCALKALGPYRKKVREFPHTEAFAVGAWFATEGNAKPVTTEARVSFERAFGVSLEEQVRLEKSFEKMTFSSEWKMLDHILTRSDLLDYQQELLR